MDARAVDDAVAMAALLRDRLGDTRAPLALRGSSMGGYLAILAAAPAHAQAVVAICPASAVGLRRGLAAGRFSFAADREAVDAFLAAHELRARGGGAWECRCCCCTPRATSRFRSSTRGSSLEPSPLPEAA